MTDARTPDPADGAGVSLSKPSKAAGNPGTPDSDEPEKLPRPPQILWLVSALGVAAVGAIVTAVLYQSQDTWLLSQLRNSYTKAHKKVPSQSDLVSQIASQQRGALIGSIVVAVVLAILAVGAYRGRPWSRWAVVAVWVLSSFTGTFIGISWILAAGQSVPGAIKGPAFVAAAAMIVAVLVVNLKPNVAYFVQNRPPRPEGMAQRRGLFAPREPIGAARTRPDVTTDRTPSVLTSSAASRGEAYIRSKSRSGVDSQRAGRAPESRGAGKSRRSGN